MRAEPVNNPQGTGNMAITRYPAKKRTGAKYFIPEGNIPTSHPNIIPTRKATTSKPTMMRVIAFPERFVPFDAAMAKFVG